MDNIKERAKMSQISINIFSTLMSDEILRWAKISNPKNCIFIGNIRSRVSENKVAKSINTGKIMRASLRGKKMGRLVSKEIRWLKWVALSQNGKGRELL